MPSNSRWKITSTSPSHATTCRSQTPTFFAPRLADSFAASTLALCRERRAAALVDSAPALPALEPVAQAVEQVEPERAHPGWSSPRLEQGLPFPLTIPH